MIHLFQWQKVNFHFIGLIRSTSQLEWWDNGKENHASVLAAFGWVQSSYSSTKIEFSLPRWLSPGRLIWSVCSLFFPSLHSFWAAVFVEQWNPFLLHWRSLKLNERNSWVNAGGLGGKTNETNPDDPPDCLSSINSLMSNFMWAQ